ncbi:MAG TPA: cobalamin biosynthesis protein [Cyanothece sp. UBA12306]|nr:cobalamin biosynthesis protein [Cyanothece sp. UBA12306]
MKTNVECIVLVLAAIIDYIIGDPIGYLHPVQVMGWTISNLSQFAIATCSQKWQRRWGGIVIALGVILGTGIIGWSLVKIAENISPLLGIGLQSILLASCFAGKSLRKAAQEVILPLSDRKLDLARTKLGQYVGRDTDNLSEQEILRAVLETVTENATDGVTSPLFYGIIGGFFPVIGSVPLALGYKAASTLDSMIGYQKEPFIDLGWFSAKFEDFLTWIPCRLTVLTLALISRKPGSVLAICLRDAPQDPSPNSGWSECVYAAILGVQLGGTNTYQGQIKSKPLLGNGTQLITPEIIEQALQLTRICCLLWLCLAIMGLRIITVF